MRNIRQYRATKNTMSVTNPVRANGYTTNSEWLIDSSYEPEWLRALPSQNTENTNQPKALEKEIEDRYTMGVKYITNAHYEAYEEMELIDAVNTDTYIHPLVKFQSNEFWSWVNARYVNFFLSTKRPLRFYQGTSLTPLYIIDDEKQKLLGVIMPVRINK